MRRRALLLAVLVLPLLAGCSVDSLSDDDEDDDDDEPEAATKAYAVLKDGRTVLTVKNESGPLYSTSLPPLGSKPTIHPFVTATARDPGEEDALRKILDESSDFDDFIARLQAAGYTLKELRP